MRAIFRLATQRETTKREDPSYLRRTTKQIGRIGSPPVSRRDHVTWLYDLMMSNAFCYAEQRRGMGQQEVVEIFLSTVVGGGKPEVDYIREIVQHLGQSLGTFIG